MKMPFPCESVEGFTIHAYLRGPPIQQMNPLSHTHNHRNNEPVDQTDNEQPNIPPDRTC